MIASNVQSEPHGVFQNITVIVPRTLGATLLSTVVLRQLRRKLPHRTIRCVAKFTDVLEGLPYIDEIWHFDDPHVFEGAIKDNEVIDLTSTLHCQPNRRYPPIHLIDVLCRHAGIENDAQGPECFLSRAELNAAQQLVTSNKVEHDRMVIAMTTRTSTRNKEWRHERWVELVQRMGNQVSWLHLGEHQGPLPTNVQCLSLSPRQSIALTRFVDGVVTLDTFLLHAAATQRIKSGAVVTLLGSSHPSCVSYQRFHNLYFNEYECQPCGRPYSPFDLLILPDGSTPKWPNGKAKKWECEHVACMDLITVDVVLNAIQTSIFQTRKSSADSIKPCALGAMFAHRGEH
jgi:ADP-heptose:LPS heptosyltransferase